LKKIVWQQPTLANEALRGGRDYAQIQQIALNWLLQRPTVFSVSIGEYSEKHFRQDLSPKAGS
jgi:aryl-alcohol dehydrogenase-like predicted oxidoreductase